LLLMGWILFNSYNYFPKGTTFLCVVDPGVGSKRNPIAIKTKNYFFVGPDNGLMYPAANNDSILNIIKLKEGTYTSKTFHGRDLFSKIAAKIDSNKSFTELGTSIKINNKLNFYLKGRIGEIVRIDNFGNIITNLKPLNKSTYSLKYRNKIIKLNYYDIYNASKENELFLITGSSKTLEISVRNGSAIKKFKAKIDDKIEIN